MGETHPRGDIYKTNLFPIGYNGDGDDILFPRPIPIGDPVSNRDTAVNLKIFTNKLVKTKKALKKP